MYKLQVPIALTGQAVNSTKFTPYFESRHCSRK